MASVNLGSIKFNWKGAYNAGTAYAVDDVVSHSGSSYVCILASTGNVPTNTTYWNIMSSKGTDGTDVGTTLTTQGDILYRDGSGLQRLAAGTSGQVLKTGGSGANPSWGTLSSDLVKIASNDTTPSGTLDYVDFQNVFDDTTYHSYQIRIGELQVSGHTGANLRWQFLNGSTPFSSGVYVSIGTDQFYVNASSGSVSTGSNWNEVNIGEFRITNWGGAQTGTNWSAGGMINIFSVQDTAIYPYFTWDGYATDSNTPWFSSQHGVGVVKSTSAFDGFRIKLGNNYIRKMDIAVYGFKR